LLEQNLETVLSTDHSAERGRFAWMRWALPLAVVVLVVAASLRYRGYAGGVPWD
jgi:hypothetical protein